MKILLAGPQGSGKTTQATLISEDLHLPHFSTGRFLRGLSKGNSKIGRLIKNHLLVSTLIPDDLILDLVRDELSKPHYSRGFVIEGNPRTINQAKKFKAKLDFVIYLKLSDKECIERLLKRNREDDTKKLIKVRLNIYHKETEPMLNYYQDMKILYEIDGSPPIINIHNTVAKIVGIKKHAPHQIGKPN